VAKAIVASQEKTDGLIRPADLDAYQVKFRNPIMGNFKGYQIVSMPPPSSGGTHIVQILNVLAKDDLKGMGPYTPKAIHLTASAMQMAFADRAEYLGDSNFVKIPLLKLVSETYGETLRKKILPEKARASADVKAEKLLPGESNETTHLSIMDSSGDTVAATQTVNGHFGSGLVVEGAGFFMNNEMNDFVVKPGVPNMFGAVGNNKNAIEPKKRPLSSMSLTFVLKDGIPPLALGSPKVLFTRDDMPRCGSLRFCAISEFLIGNAPAPTRIGDERHNPKVDELGWAHRHLTRCGSFCAKDQEPGSR
jgi:gamma-glutamyltranspeptidase/glutathione hydrolase